MGVTSYLTSWLNFFEAEGKPTQEVEAALLQAATAVAAAHFGPGPRVVAGIGDVGLHLGLQFFVNDSGESGTLPGDLVRELGPNAVTTGQVVSLPVCFTRHPAQSKLTAELGARLHPHFDKGLHVPEIWPALEDALQSVLWDYLGGIPAATPGSLEEKLRVGLSAPLVAEVGGGRVELLAVEWQLTLDSPTLRRVGLSFELSCAVDGGVPVRLTAASHLGWSDRQWAAIGPLPAAPDLEQLQTTLERFAADHDTLAKIAVEHEARLTWGGPVQWVDWFEPLLEAFIAQPPADSLFGWLAERLAADARIEGPTLLPSSFGKVTAVVGEHEVLLGSLGRAALELKRPAPDLQQWLDDRLGELDDYVSSHSGDEDEAWDHWIPPWPLADVLERCVRTGTTPAPIPPLSVDDELATRRLANRLSLAPPDAPRGLEHSPAGAAIDGWRGDVWPIRLATFDIDGWRLELIGERSYPHSFTSMLLVAPGSSEHVPLLWNDIWAWDARWCVDGERFTFQAFVDLLRRAIAVAELDARVDIRTLGDVYFSKRGRAELRRELGDGEADLLFARLDDQGQRVFELALAADVPTGDDTMMLTEWLRFQAPEPDLRWVLDWRVDYPACVGQGTILENAAAMYGFGPELVRQLRDDAIPVWRRFLREAVDPRLAP